MKNKVAHVIRSLGYPQIVIKSDQESAIRRMERKVVESLYGCAVVMQHSPVGELATNRVIECAYSERKDRSRAIELD